MIKNKKIYRICIFLNLIYLFILTFIKDPTKYNYSMLSSSPLGYIGVWILCVLLSINISVITQKYNKNLILISLIGPILAAIFPYQEGVGDLFSNLHELLAYVSFSIVNIISLLNYYKYSLIYYKKGKNYLILYLFVIGIDLVLYLNSMGALAYQQLILLSTILIINYLVFD